MSEFGCAERNPSASVPVGFPGRRERSERRHGKRADLYIGVRSALIYQKSGDFRIKVNKAKSREIAYSYSKRFLPFFRKKACEEKINNEEVKESDNVKETKKHYGNSGFRDRFACPGIIAGNTKIV